MSTTITVQDKIFTPYIAHQKILTYVGKVAQSIYRDYKNETPVFIGVLNGVFMFYADLMKAYPGACEVAFLQMKSYEGTLSSGKVETKMELTKDIRNRHIIIVEDIVDTGNTLMALYDYFKTTQTPDSLRIASLFLKPEAYHKAHTIDYVGKEIPDKFILGYGLDYNEQGRNLKDLYQLQED